MNTNKTLFHGYRFPAEITGQMRAIGITKGKPFNPDARMKKILTEAAAVGNATARTISLAPRDEAFYLYGKKSTWYTPLVRKTAKVIGLMAARTTS